MRPIDQHIKGLRPSAPPLTSKDGFVCAAAPADGLTGGRVNLDVVSVGATMNIMIGAVLANGTTVIENAAKEPHIVDLANFLNAMGAKVTGAGTDVIKIRGVRSLHGGSYSIIPDQIEDGHLYGGRRATGGDAHPECHPQTYGLHLRQAARDGREIAEYDDAIRVQRTGRHAPGQCQDDAVSRLPSTDMQPQIAVCMSLASGVSVITESIYDTRFGYCAELNRMGASIKVDTKVAIITGVESCTAAPCAPPTCARGAAMVIAGLAADRTTTIEDIEYIERGYEKPHRQAHRDRRGDPPSAFRMERPSPQQSEAYSSVFFCSAAAFPAAEHFAI